LRGLSDNPAESQPRKLILHPRDRHTFSVIDRLYGGQGEGIKFSRDLTDIEQAVMEGIIIRVLGNLRESLRRIIDLRLAQIVPPSEMIVLVTFEAKVGDERGMINLCIPYLILEPIIPKLSAQYWYSHATGVRGRLTSRLGFLEVETELYFETEELSLRELAGLKKNH